MSNIKRKPVAFNIDDPLQKQLLEYTGKFSNFSFYIKSLILRDMNGELVNANQDIDINEIENENSFDKDLLKSFI